MRLNISLDKNRLIHTNSKKKNQQKKKHYYIYIVHVVVYSNINNFNICIFFFAPSPG